MFGKKYQPLDQGPVSYGPSFTSDMTEDEIVEEMQRLQDRLENIDVSATEEIYPEESGFCSWFKRVVGR